MNPKKTYKSWDRRKITSGLIQNVKKQSGSATYAGLTCYKMLLRRTFKPIKMQGLEHKILRQSKRLAEKELIENIEIYKRNPRLFFEKFKYIKQGYKARLTLMKDGQGNLIIDTKKSVMHFMEFFKRISNSIQDNITPYEKLIYHTAEPESIEPTLDEVKIVINCLKNNKSPDENNINSELIKLAGKHLATEIHKLIYNVWTREKIPTDWNMAIICPIFKKGDPAKVENYRGISLLDTSYKVLSLTILSRL